MPTRTEFRRRLQAVREANAPAQRITSLGMHFVPAPDGTPVLVLVEINVSRLLATLGPKVCRNKCGMSAAGGGAVRVSLATPDARELCAQLRTP